MATFLFLSGYLTRISNDNWGRFYRKRIFRVLIPYFIWTVLYTFAFHDFHKLPIYLLTTKAEPHLYYIFVYIQFVLLTPLLGRLATSRYHFIGWFIAPISALVYKYSWLQTGHPHPYPVALFWSDSCLCWFTFYYLGLMLGNHIVDNHFSLKTLLPLYVIAIFLQMIEGYGFFLYGTSDCGTQLKITSLLTSSLFCLCIHAILREGHCRLKNTFLLALGDYSFGIYLCHFMFIRLLKTHTYFFNMLPYPLTAALILFLSWGCCYLGNKICGQKLSRWLGFK